MSRHPIYPKSDEELIQLYQSTEDNQWLGLLLERHTVLLLGVAMKFLKNSEMAKDAVQQVFVKTITHFPQTHVQNFKGWLYILMRNHCLGILRDAGYQTDESLLHNLTDTPTKNREEWIQDEQTRQKLYEAIQQLNKEQQVCIRLFYIEEKSYKEIMTATGYNYEQVKSYVQNGKRNLKIALKKLNIFTS